jgi:dihydrofolate synthase/folylpolyglutamate synthase
MVYKKYMLPSTPFNSSVEIYEWICKFINMERGQSKRSFSIDRMKILADLAGHPECSAPSIHVAGSKGKGSVTGMIAAILEAAGIKTARYTSPHVSDFRERLSRGNGFFEEETYIKAGMELIELVEGLSDSPFREVFDSRFNNGVEPTFFELLTMWYFLCARKARCEALIVETGIGGRLDSTNILDPLASVITLIELEHTEYLGKTLAAIAGEKAGIVKPFKPLVLAEQCDEALEVFKESAARNSSLFLYFPECAEVRDITVCKEGTYFTLVLKNTDSRNICLRNGEENNKTETLSKLFVPIPGEIQAKNSGLAVLALKTAFPNIGNNSIYEGLAGFTLSGRFERIFNTPPVIIDGAHTKYSVDMCVKTFASLYGSEAVLIFGCAADKDIFSMAESCVPFFSAIFITRPGSFKKSLPENIYAAFLEQKQKTGEKCDIFLILDTSEAIDRAVEHAAQKGLPVLATASFYLAGEIRNKLKP